jgi:hypothetical protein
MLTVMVALPEAVSEEGLKAALAPEGKPATESETVPAKPFSALVKTL